MHSTIYHIDINEKLWRIHATINMHDYSNVWRGGVPVDGKEGWGRMREKREGQGEVGREALSNSTT